LVGVSPNPACSGHGFAVRQPRRFQAEKLSPAKLSDKHAVPLTQSLGKGWRKQRRVESQGAGRSGKVKLVLGSGGAGETIASELSRVVV